MRSFYDFLFHGIRENLAHLYEKPEQIEKIREQHEAVLDAIKKRDPDQAYDAMKIHIMYVLDFFKKQGEYIQ